MAISRNIIHAGIQPEIFNIFDVTASWGTNGVTDQSSFQTLLESKGYSGISIENFTLVSQRLICNLEVLIIPGNTFNLNNLGITVFNGFGYVPNAYTLDLSFNSLTNFTPAYTLPNYVKQLNISVNQLVTFTPDATFIENLTGIQLNANQIENIDLIIPLLPIGLLYLGIPQNSLTAFDPLIPLPPSLIQLDLTKNSISVFNPTLPLPSTLLYLTLAANALSVFDPTLPLPSGLLILDISGSGPNFNPKLPLPSGLISLSLNSCGITVFNPTLPLPSTLERLELMVNEITFFGPTNPLPTTVNDIRLDSNKMTLIDYTNNIPWATALHNGPGFGGYITFTFNTDTVSGTAFESILNSKAWNVIS